MKQKFKNCTYLWSSPEAIFSLLGATEVVPDPTNIGWIKRQKNENNVLLKLPLTLMNASINMHAD